MYFAVYKITNLLNGKPYIGAHKTDNLDDAYTGSGNAINAAIKKYGIENFKKEILFLCNSEEEMYLKEAEIVDAAFVRTDKTYNETLGGRGGWYHVHNDPLIVAKRNTAINSKEAKAKHAVAMTRLGNDPEHKKKLSEGLRKRYSDPAARKVTSEAMKLSHQLKPRTQSEETKRKISEALKKRNGLRASMVNATVS